MRGLGLGLALALSCAMGTAHAEISDNVVRIGVLNDISGIFQDTNGMGSVEAARMAATYPAQFLGLDLSRGRIARGHAAYFVELDDALAVRCM